MTDMKMYQIRSLIPQKEIDKKLKNGKVFRKKRWKTKGKSINKIKLHDV